MEAKCAQTGVTRRDGGSRVRCPLDNMRHCCTIYNMRAHPIIRDRIEYAEDAVAHVTVWQVSQPLPGSAHAYKYRLAYVVEGECVLRYDNEAGKGDHRHMSAAESGHVFTDLAQLLVDFAADIERWNHENGIV